jgi:predicted small metal-binding protein
MKKITCKEMGGDCDAVITAETAAEMMEKGKAHVMEAHAADASSHAEIMEKMKAMTDEEFVAWQTDFTQKFEGLEEA